jgi:hypothetical protein
MTKYTHKIKVIDQALYDRTVREVDTSGLTRRYSRYVADGPIRITRTDGTVDVHDTVYNGQEFLKTHGFIITQEMADD